jgi:hypothetical protein
MCSNASSSGRARLLLVLAPFVLLGLPVRAQVARPADAFVRPGYPLGQFRAFPSVTFENVYDDNIFAQEDREEDDYVISIVPTLAVESSWSRHSLSANAHGRINRYADITEEDSEEYAVEARGRFDVADQSALGATFGQGRRTVARADSENSGRRDPQQLDYFEGQLRYDHDFARFDLDLRGFVDHLDYRDSQDRDRDRNEFGGSSRLSHRISPAFSIFLEPDVEVRDYDQTVDDDGVKRSSTTFGGFLGGGFDTSIIEGEISLGPVHTAFDDSSFDDLTILGARAAVRWDVTTLTRLGAEMERSVVPTSVDSASSKVRTLVTVEGRHELFRNVVLRADATYFREDFEELGRDDDNYRVSVGARYLINRFFSIGARYSYRERDSNGSTRDFRRNIGMLTLEAQL